MEGVQYGINYGAGRFVADGLGTDFYGGADGRTLGIENIFRVVIMEILRVVWQEYKIVSILVLVDVFLDGYSQVLMEICVASWLGTGFDRDSYGITLQIYKVIELVFSYRYF